MVDVIFIVFFFRLRFTTQQSINIRLVMGIRGKLDIS